MKKALRIFATFLRETLWLVIAAAIIFGGVAGFRYLGENREVVEIAAVERPVALVETLEVERFDRPLPLRADGFIQPYRQITVSTSVGGRIADLHPAIVGLGRFDEGDVLVEIDNTAQQANLNQTQANIEATQARLDLTRSQLTRTTELRERGVASQQALDQLQSQEAELIASLNSLRAASQSAEIALGNTRVVAPFSGAVRSKSQEVGNVIAAGQAVAEIYTNDRMEVVIPIREADAALIPGLFSDGMAEARVSVAFSGQVYEWDAHLTRVDPALDSRTRTLSATVEIDDIANPRLMNADALANGTPPALINAFASVEIDGVRQENTYAIPTTALRNANELWLFEPGEGEEGTLRTLVAQPIHVDGETTYVRIDDWPDDTRLIRTTLAGVTEGMPLRDVSASQMGQGSSSADTE
ncbi:efflux RND transporter periplasmic adaptor subunit [Yoonia sp. 208BN28-4]|uniref:efflux RND transporter periplasmic adaptor subunit n=1 Tax=Yoonia sp. 208BN28-4 TaxID=3126505 RepID=UPI0030A3E58A